MQREKEQKKIRHHRHYFQNPYSSLLQGETKILRSSDNIPSPSPNPKIISHDVMVVLTGN